MLPNCSVVVLSDTAKALKALSQLVQQSEEIYLAYAWASSNKGKDLHWKALSLDKITKVVIGIHFAQTEPEAIEWFAQKRDALKIVDDTAGVFHPKVIVGIKGDKAQAVVGSSNLTKGGFSGNTELNLLLNGFRTEPPLSEIIEFVEREWNSPRATSLNEDWLIQYREAYTKRPKPLQIEPTQKAVSPLVQSTSDLNISWVDFYDLITAQERRTLANQVEIHVFDHPDGSYLQEADLCRDAFTQYDSFLSMPEEKRKLVSGFGKETFGYFGRMTGAGRFKGMVLTFPEEIAQNLDKISLTDTISLQQIELYLNSMIALKGVNFGASTRLLSVKRPDLFLTFNKANKNQIDKIFGKVPWSVNGYIKLHRQIWSFPWFQAPEPSSASERRVWNNRAALLDSLLYELPDYQSESASAGPKRS